MDTHETRSYQDLIVWQKSMDLVVAVYELTRIFPSNEQFGLISQLRRAVVSIPSNIAEGYRRKGSGDYQRFLRIAFGSASEVETQLLIAIRLKYCVGDQISQSAGLVTEVSKMLNRMTFPSAPPTP